MQYTPRVKTDIKLAQCPIAGLPVTDSSQFDLIAEHGGNIIGTCSVHKHQIHPWYVKDTHPIEEQGFIFAEMFGVITPLYRVGEIDGPDAIRLYIRDIESITAEEIATRYAPEYTGVEGALLYYVCFGPDREKRIKSRIDFHNLAIKEFKDHRIIVFYDFDINAFSNNYQKLFREDPLEIAKMYCFTAKSFRPEVFIELNKKVAERFHVFELDKNLLDRIASIDIETIIASSFSSSCMILGDCLRKIKDRIDNNKSKNLDVPYFITRKRAQEGAILSIVTQDGLSPRKKLDLVISGYGIPLTKDGAALFYNDLTASSIVAFMRSNAPTLGKDIKEIIRILKTIPRRRLSQEMKVMIANDCAHLRSLLTIVEEDSSFNIKESAFYAKLVDDINKLETARAT